MPIRSRYLSALLLPFLLLSVACDGDEPTDDAGPDDDGGPPPTCEAPVPFEEGDVGHASPLSAGPGEVRAGRLAAADLPEDPNGLAVYEAGDFVLANDRIAILIEDAGPSDLYDPFGGRPVGIARVEDGRLVDRGDYNEVLMGFGGFLVATEHVGVIADGSDGGAAIIRAVGPLGPLEFAGELLSGIVPGEFTGLPAAMDYRLEPGSDAVEVTLTVDNVETSAARTNHLLLGFFQYHRMPFWTRGEGFSFPEGATELAGFIDDDGASYAWIPPGASMNLLLEVSGVAVFSLGRASVPGCARETFALGHIAIGGNGLSGLQESLARFDDRTIRTLTGTVRESDGSTPDPSSVRVHVVDAEGAHFARVRPDADGAFSIAAPEGPVEVYAYREGMPLVGPVAVGGGDTSVDVTLEPFGTLRVEVSGTDGEPLPARVQVIADAGLTPPPDGFGENVARHGRSHIAFSIAGAIELPVVPDASYRVLVSRGFEYELVTASNVSAAAGEVEPVPVVLERVVDTTDIMCADFHIHTHRSPDAPDSPEHKLMGLIADGLEIPMRADHEWVNDFQEVIERLGLEAYARGIGGEELTTFAWGHFGVFPLVEDRDQVNGSAIPWVGRQPPEVFAEVRARPEDPSLIIFHPRSGGSIFGYFIAAGFDPTTGEVSRPEMWDDEFTLVEAFNDSSFEANRDTTVRDWFAFLNQGRRIYVVGSSDSHIIATSPVGYPRTCLDLGTDDPRDIDERDVQAATEAGHATVSGGIYLDVFGPGGTRPGDEASGVGDEAAIEVRVQAAAWIGVDRLEVIVDGETQEIIPIGDPPDPLVPTTRFVAEGAGAISVPVAPGGSWVVLHAAGPGDLAPVHPGRAPFAVSNPIFLRR